MTCKSRNERSLNKLGNSLSLIYIDVKISTFKTEYSAAWLARLLWEQWVGGSNPSTPITLNQSILASQSIRCGYNILSKQS